MKPALRTRFGLPGMVRVVGSVSADMRQSALKVISYSIFPKGKRMTLQTSHLVAVRQELRITVGLDYWYARLARALS